MAEEVHHAKQKHGPSRILRPPRRSGARSPSAPDTTRRAAHELLNLAAQRDLEAELIHGGCFGLKRLARLRLAGRIHNLNVIRFVACHELIACDVLHYQVHHRPLRGR